MPTREDDGDRRRDDYDDYDDRPRRKKSGGGSGLVIALVVGGVLLLMLCVVGGLFVLLLPAVTKVREAAGRVNDQNNLKQVGLGLHNELSATNQWTVPFARDQSGKVYQTNSFRVSLLPYLGEPGYDTLYRSFDLTQPWDSQRNRPHSSATVKPYQTNLDETPGNLTPYRAFVGGGALFEADGKPVKFTDIKDGTANTIMLVHATEQVPWAAPKELPYGPNASLPPLGHPKMAGGTNVLMADGSVRFLKKDTPERVIRALITKAGNEELPPDW
jgi:prepilin-type processing-associated H-X9-DG protein